MSEMVTITSAKKPAAPDVDSATHGSDVFAWSDRFVRRHIGPDAEETGHMLELCGFKTLDALINATVPEKIRLRKPMNLPHARSEHGLLAELRKIASLNRVYRSFIGMGYHDCITPPV